MNACRSATFALPGDIDTLTGGYLYDRRLVEGLRAQGRRIDILSLPNSMPFPGPADMATALRQLIALPPDRPVIIDGLAFGALEPEGVAAVTAPIVAMIHHPLAQESALPADLANHLWRTEKDNLALARAVMVPSPHTRDMLVERYDVPAGRITVVRPGTDRPVSASPSLPINPPLILSVGILHPRKGHDILITALSRLCGLDWQAVIVGNPWDHAHVEALRLQLASAGLGSRLRLAGRVPHDALQTLYRQASIFALATRYEGYGIVFDEALSHGLPIVSTLAGAVPETVPHEAGLLVQPDDPQAFADALRRLLSHPQERFTLAKAAAQAGRVLPAWDETARLAGAVLDNLYAPALQ
ncbi:glycosyltransferase family 4 protein [Paracoccus sp. (in: a-proteobacteria)]|uniref:glycosyltransferase family 4 protein n=1 Tax=Paracoccus sp. TaxID=267 RepID=UPI00396C5A54